MVYFIEIWISALLLINLSQGIYSEDTFVINDPNYQQQIPYTIVSTNERTKRDQASWFYPELDQNQISCGHNVYVKLYTCSHLTECRALSTCLESVHCPLTIKSTGGLILNLLRSLGLNECGLNNANQSCPFEKRLIILQKLVKRWTIGSDDNYCNSVASLMGDVRNEMQSHCPLNSVQVETFLSQYQCERTTTISSSAATHIGYINEEDQTDLNFVNANKNLFNSTEQTVYVNDHQYYNVSYIVPVSERVPINFVEDRKQFTTIDALSNRHRSAYSLNLQFAFPFYGHLINKILVATGGFIYTGDLLHSALIGSTQYIAPFMANFDVSIGHNESEIKYFDNGTHFVCTWNKIFLQDQQEAGPFTFQVILQNTGNIYFNYLRVPQVNISSSNHAHRIGLSDAYMSQHSTNEHVVRVITLYNKINLDHDRIQTGVSIVFDMDQTCNTFTDCSSCLANRGIRYNCSWCDDIQKCSDGYDRSRHQWLRAQCHYLAAEKTCPTSTEDTFDHNSFPFASPLVPFLRPAEERKQLQSPSSPTRRQYSALQTFRTVLVTLLLSVLVLSLIALTGTYLYAYRHPTSPAGMWLLEHRPTDYIARFKRFTGSN